jgi:CTP:molybdopterin cytidylyltransferase MocA
MASTRHVVASRRPPVPAVGHAGQRPAELDRRFDSEPTAGKDEARQPADGQAAREGREGCGPCGRVRLDAVRTTVAGVLLAAGEGSRFGQPKALVEFSGQTLAERGVNLLRAGGADPILVVTGAVPLELDGTLTVANPQWRTGMGSSLRAALQALTAAGAGAGAGAVAGAGAGAGADRDVSAVVVALADQPLVGAEAVARLIAAHRAGASVAVAAYDGQPRNPVLLAREHWPEVIETAIGDQGARTFLRAHPDLVTLVECGDTGRPDDIDTPADLARITAAADQAP